MNDTIRQLIYRMTGTIITPVWVVMALSGTWEPDVTATMANPPFEEGGKA